MKGIITLLLFSVCFAFPALAQPENTPVETINGKKYYVHIVEQGNTLYGIHKVYGASVVSILEANEGLTDNLVVGQKVYIPIATDDDRHYAVHEVQQGETLYGISKKYDCSVTDLKQLNSGLSDGISPGQKITVPKKGGVITEPGEVIQSDPVPVSEVSENDYSILLKDSLVKHVVLPHETMYSIAKRYMVSSDTIMQVNKLRNTRIKKGDVLLIPVVKVNYQVTKKDLSELTYKSNNDSLIVEESKFKDSYNVALMLPLMLDRNDKEMSAPLKLDQVREMYSTTKISFAFYQGFLLAADSLSKAGLSVNVFVYDTKRDTAEVRKCFAKREFNDMDLVVGPLYGKTMKQAVKLSEERRIRIVLPFNSDMDLLYQNRYVYKGVASNMTLLDGVVDYLIEHHKHHNIVVIKPTSSSDLALYERVRERFNQKIVETNGSYNGKLVETSLGSSSGRDLNNILKSDTTNVVIVPSTNLTFVSGAMGRLNKVMNMNPYAKNMKVIAFGLEEWNKFDNLDIKYRNRLHQHYASYRFLDYTDEQTIEFIKAYRKSYGIDPNVYSSQGFDIGMYFLSALHLYGTNFDQAVSQHQIPLIQNQFNFRPIDPQSGRENRHVCIVRYDNYKLVRLK